MTLPPPVTSPRRALVAPVNTAWAYLRHELLFLCFALMEVSLITPVAMVIMGWARYWPPWLVTLWLLILMLLPLNLIRLMSLLQVDTKQQRWIMFFALLMTVIVSWRVLLYPANGFLDLSWIRQFTGSLAEGGNLLWTRDLSLFICTLVVWWRGIRLAGRTPEINNTGLRLRLGGLIFLPLIIWFSSLYLDHSIVPFVLLFFFAGLNAVALVRAEQIEQEQRGTAATLNAWWFAVVAAVAAIIPILGGAISAFISGESLFLVISWLSPLWRAIQFGALVGGTVFLKLTSPLLNVFAFFVQWLSVGLSRLIVMLSRGLRETDILEGLALPITITTVETVDATGGGFGDRLLVTFFMLVMIAAVSLTLVQAYRRAMFAARESTRGQPNQTDTDEEKPGLGRRLLERLGLTRQWRVAASIKRIYKQMCELAAAYGFPRLESETPYEYLLTLAEIWPNHIQDFTLITEAFVLARYGEVPETQAEFDRIRQAWNRLEETEPARQATDSETMPILAKRE